MILSKLIAKNNYVALEHGHLVIVPASGKPIPSDWMTMRQREILLDISATTKLTIFQYMGYSTGRYGYHLSPGVLLNYVNIQTGQTCPIIFNAELTRSRTNKRGKAGQDLPQDQFRVGPNHAFTKYWEKLGLELPRRPSEFHYSMGKLKNVFISARVDDKGRIIKQSIGANITHEDIHKGTTANHSFTGNSLARNWQATGNLLASNTGKEVSETQSLQGFAANLSTCAEEYEQSNKGSASNAPSSTTIDTLRDQSVEDWLSDYSAMCNGSGVKSR